MPRLRMKDSTSTDEAVLSAQHRAARKSRRKHRRRSPSESLTPPRTQPSTSGTPDEWGFDESALPPEQAYKRTRTDDEFLESLADAEAQDQGVGYHEEVLYSRQMPSYSTHYSSAAGAAAGIEPRKGDYLAAMDEEEYAEYVRAGIWRMKNREEMERRERAEKEKKKREEREKKENEKRNREEKERIRRLEERRKRKSKEDEEGARRRYDEAWRRLQQPNSAASTDSSSAPPAARPSADPSASDPSASASSASSSSTPYPLRFTDFPWPLYPPLALPPLSWPTVPDLTAPAISTFLLGGAPPDKHKAVLRQAVLAYHPDRFERLVARVPEEKEDVRERVRELGLRVSQVLNEVMKQR
ncbi:hypothetical protein JCM11251_007504 [Rhodosporidiobolus azoricus]